MQALGSYWHSNTVTRRRNRKSDAFRHKSADGTDATRGHGRGLDNRSATYGYAQVASGILAFAVEQSLAASSSYCGRAACIDAHSVLDSQILHLDHSAYAAGPPVHIGHGHDGGAGSEGRRRPGGRSGRHAWAQEFGCAVYRRVEEPDLSGTPR